MVHHVLWPAALLIGIAAQGRAGLIGGAIVVYAQVPPIIAPRHLLPAGIEAE
jgi:predicted ABC-type sugar transport system permease subunit